MKKSRKESELNTVDSQIKGLDMRLKYGKTDKENTVSIQSCIPYDKYVVLHSKLNFVYFL